MKNNVNVERTEKQEKAYQFLITLEEQAKGKVQNPLIHDERDPFYDGYDHEPTLHLSSENMKIGKHMRNISTLCGDADHIVNIRKLDKPVTNVPGTCCKLCEGCFKYCYAMNSLRQYYNSCGKSWTDNTVLLRRKSLFRLIYEQLLKDNKKYYETKDPKDIKTNTFRINVSGEVENAEQFACWNALAILMPEIQFGIYTKNFVALDEFIQKYGMPEKNFVINLSQWHHCADEFIHKYPLELYPKMYNIFEYDDSNRKDNELSEADKERLAMYRHCPALDSHGNHQLRANGEPITCMDCRRCYRKTGDTTAVYDH